MAVKDSDRLLEERKNEHLRVALEKQVEVPQGIGWDAIRLVPRALPEIHRDDIDTSVRFLGRKLALPLLIGSMTGGTQEAKTYNMRLASAAARAGVGMGLGSQRVMLRHEEQRETFMVRSQAPELPLLIANFGAVQLNDGIGLEQLRKIVEDVDADALVLHLNASQEAVQPEGDINFSGLVEKISDLAKVFPYPLGLKEVGAGFSMQDADLLQGLPLAFMESAGAGGTSWTRIEGMRRGASQSLGELFANWGVPSVTSLLNCLRLKRPTIASGGIRSGLDGARALAAGADVVAMALPMLKAAALSEDAVYDEIMRFREALVTAMFLTGAKNVQELKSVRKRIANEAKPEYWEGYDG